MKSVSQKMAVDWAACYKACDDANISLVYPSEPLIRMFKGNYIGGKALDLQGKSCIDVGFGNANNLAFLATLGMDVAGIEIHEAICDEARNKFARTNLNADIKLGTNQEIPFKDNHFDYLVSWNVLHYEGSEDGIKAAIKEFARVLKPGGRFFLSTTGPDHKILKNSRTLGNHLYEIGREDDFRAGQTHFFFDGPNYIDLYFSPYFKNIQIGRIEDDMFGEKLDWWIATGVKA